MKNKRVYKKVTLSVHDVVVTKRIFLKDSNLFSPISLILPGSLVFAIIQLISSNKVFCQKFLWCLVHHNILVQGALDTKLNFSKEIICWSILNVWIVEKIQLEYMMACLSTLGGAYSSLGENSHSHALVAGTLSVRQFLIATRMNDLIMMSRCRIFYAYSLMQQRKLKTAANIIRREYIYSKTALHDNTLVKTCCLAVWNRLKYLSAKKKERKDVIT